jgi:hypothetical protein
MSLSPSLAADLANGVYGIREMAVGDSVAQAFARRGVRTLNGEFAYEGSTVVSGVTGGRILNAREGFAIVMPGGGGRSNELAVAVRGTVTGYDWLSNLSAGLCRGPTGQRVHIGFNRVAASIVQSIRRAVAEMGGASHIHVVGHSLGGAVGSLVAAQLHADGGSDVELYTFGAPRVGLESFAQSLTRGLPFPIRRVYNPSDIVPMVPIFPFRHAPMPGDGIVVRSEHGMVSIEAHFMSTYGPAVKDRTWDALLAASSQRAHQLSVSQWLDFASEHSVIPGSTLALHALAYALEGIVEIAKRQLGLAVTLNLTLLDSLAWLLVEAAQMASAIGARVMTLMRTILRFAGSAASVPAELTARFVRWVLGLLLRPMAAIAQRAFQRIDQGA